MSRIHRDIDELLSRALGEIDPSSTSKSKYQNAISQLESVLQLSGLLIKSLGAPKNYGNRISEATGAGATAVVLVADGDVDHEALVRAYCSRAVRPVPTLLVLKEERQCVAVEVISEGENPFPGVELRTVATSCEPEAPSPDVLDAILQLDGGPWDVARKRLDELEREWPTKLVVKYAPDQKNLMNRIREAAGRRPSVLAVVTTADLRASCGRALEELADLVGESVVVIDGRTRVLVETAATAANHQDEMPASTRSRALAEAQRDKFAAWNAVLLRDFFSPTQAGEEVTLSVSREELDDIAPELGGFEGLLKALAQGPSWPLPDGRYLTNLALGLMHQRLQPRSRPPTYIHPTRLLNYGCAADHFPSYLPLLAALVALVVEYQHGEGGFYEHARHRLALDNSWANSDLERINALWFDLESWTTNTDGRFGVFHARTLGRRPVMGMVKSQSIIRASDVEKLHYLFARLRLTPGEPVPKDRVDPMLRRIREEHVLSRGLRDASSQDDYRSALVERLNYILQDWDGSSPSGGYQATLQTATREYSRLGMALFAEQGRPPWRLGWRVPGLYDDGRVTLSCGAHARWHAVFDGGPYAVAEPDESSGAQCALIGSETNLTVCHEDGLRPSQGGKSLTWMPSPVVFLAFHPRHRCLVELDALPANGASYVLMAPGDRRVDDGVSLPSATLTACPNEGLPNGWRLFFLPDAAALTQVHRELLTGKGAASSIPRPIRLVGGLRIRRAGRYVYLPHDLPMVEVDAPPGCDVRAPGLELVEIEEATPPTPGGLLRASSRRTFEIQVVRDDVMSFTLSVVTREDRTLGKVTLRLSAGDAEETDGDIDLVPACRSAERGVALRGMMVEGIDAQPAVATRFDVSADRLGLPCSKDLERLAFECPEMRFLDALSQGTGRMPYGRARNLLRRYLADEDRMTTATFEALRQRGMIEIRSDSRGRWTLVGAVRPTLYALMTTVRGDSTWGVCGTLSVAHWRHLESAGARLYVTRGPDSGLPVFRLRGDVREEVPFRRVTQPPSRIVACSSSLEEMRGAFAEHGFESLDERAHDRQWFQPLCADWSDSAPPSEFDWLLLRYTDPDTGRHRLHSLRSGVPGSYRYRHVRNERWATWMAYDSCVRHFESLHPGLAPWPLSYHAEARALWVPARMRLPLILERAMVACSGGPPEKRRLLRDRLAVAGRLRVRTDDGVLIGIFDLNYSDFLPADSPRWWLKYQHVPSVVAESIAARLGCRLDDVGAPT